MAMHMHRLRSLGDVLHNHMDVSKHYMNHFERFLNRFSMHNLAGGCTQNRLLVRYV